MKTFFTVLRVIGTILILIIGGCTVDASYVREGQSFEVHVKPRASAADAPEVAQTE